VSLGPENQINQDVEIIDEKAVQAKKAEEAMKALGTFLKDMGTSLQRLFKVLPKPCPPLADVSPVEAHHGSESEFLAQHLPEHFAAAVTPGLPLGKRGAQRG